MVSPQEEIASHQQWEEEGGGGGEGEGRRGEGEVGEFVGGAWLQATVLHCTVHDAWKIEARLGRNYNFII
jgi:hypothetical protein